MIYGDSDGSGVSWGDAGSLQLLQSETTTEAHLTGVLEGGLGHNWSKGINWSWENASCLSLSDLMSLGLLSCLVEVSFVTNSFRVLAKVHVDNHVVMLDHC